MLSSSPRSRVVQSPSANPTTVVLPPYFFGASPASRSAAAAQTAPERHVEDKAMATGEWLQPQLGVGSVQTPIRGMQGPPLRSLLEDVEDDSFLPMTSGLFGTSLSRQSNIGDLTSSHSLVDYAGSVPQGREEPLSASQLDPFYTQGESFDPLTDMDDRCVTVFGFGPDSVHLILSEFGEYGVICNYEISPTGNWMHIMYQSRMQALLALGKNGKVFANRVKVGVERCIDKEVVGRFRIRAATPSGQTRAESTPTGPQLAKFRRDFRMDTSRWSMPSRSDIQLPYASSNLSVTNESYADDSKRLMRSMVVPTAEEDDNVQKGGIVSRFWDYLFG